MELVRATTPSGTPTRSPYRHLSMPPDMVDKAASRLCYISLMAAVTSVAVFIGERLLQPEYSQAQELPLVRLTLLLLVLASAGFIALQRLGLVSKQTVLYFGVLYQTVVAFAIGVFETCVEVPPDTPILGASYVALWILLSGLLIPSTPLLSVLGSGGSIVMWLLGYGTNIWVNGITPLNTNRILMLGFPALLVAVWAYVLNRRIFDMQVQAHKAEQMGSYKLDYMIGKGGMGEVWRARHRFLARDAAIKLVRPDMLVSQSGRQATLMRRRFELEAQSIAKLQSPHTVALFDFGVAQDRAFYYVMELLNGIDMQMLVDRFGPQPTGRVIRILRGVCESLEEAHRQGLVHRDIKPKNIFITRLALQYDYPKVLDFGLVKTLMPSDLGTMTLEGTASGTPAYMAPEVALGQPFDGRSDIYSLGCVAYFLLTGVSVFAEANLAALAVAHIQKEPVPPSRRTELPIPASLEALVLRCLAKRPEDRPRSARELERLLDAIPADSWTQEDAVRWWQTNLPESVSTKPPRTLAPELVAVGD
jgi:serine/threonine-protein kinase